MITQAEEKPHYSRIGQAYDITEADIRWVWALLLAQGEVVVVLPEALLETTGDPERKTSLYSSGISVRLSCFGLLLLVPLLQELQVRVPLSGATLASAGLG